MISTTSQEDAAAAAKRILGFYDTIPASDPKGFAAGLVQMLSTYPQAVVERAVHPVDGVPGSVSYLNLAEIKKFLDASRIEYLKDQERVERANRLRIAPPEPDNPEMRERIGKMFAELSQRLKASA